MALGRSQKPLFEHLAKGLDESVPRQVATGEEIAGRGQTNPHAGRVSMTWVSLYGLIVGALVLAVGCWSVGYKIGYQAGEDAWLADAREPGRAYSVDPLGSRVDGGPVDEVPMLGSTAGRVETPNIGAAVDGVSVSGILSVRGPIDGDPRQAGMNYLELATLSRAQAESALSFLGVEGVEAIAVPVVESGRSRANNPVRYRLVSIEVAIPGEQFRVMRTQRLDHERQIQRLGKAWQRDKDGASDFAQPLWKRYP